MQNLLRNKHLMVVDFCSDVVTWVWITTNIFSNSKWWLLLTVPCAIFSGVSTLICLVLAVIVLRWKMQVYFANRKRNKVG